MVLSKVCDLGSNAVSLYRGNAERELMMIAPYLINVRRVEFEWIVEKLDGTPWGYFVSTPRGITLTALRKHFRKFLLVEGPQGEELYFRFYDPRVIVDFLESATPEERDLFFGPIDTIFVNQQDGLIAVKRSSLVRP